MPFHANGCFSPLTVTFYAKILNESIALMSDDPLKRMYFCVNEFEVGANDRIFSNNEQKKVYNLFSFFNILACTSI